MLDFAILRGHDLAGAMARLLTEREQRFLRAHVGFDTGQKATLEAIGAAEGLTRERVRKLIAGAMSKRSVTSLGGQASTVAFRGVQWRRHTNDVRRTK